MLVTQRVYIYNHLAYSYISNNSLGLKFPWLFETQRKLVERRRDENAKKNKIVRTHQSVYTYIIKEQYDDNKTKSKKSCTRTCMIMIYLATTTAIARAWIINQCTVVAEEHTNAQICGWFTNIILLCVYVVTILRICHFFSMLTMESTNDFS